MNQRVYCKTCFKENLKKLYNARIRRQGTLLGSRCCCHGDVVLGSRCCCHGDVVLINQRKYRLYHNMHSTMDESVMQVNKQ